MGFHVLLWLLVAAVADCCAACGCWLLAAGGDRMFHMLVSWDALVCGVLTLAAVVTVSTGATVAPGDVDRWWRGGWLNQCRKLVCLKC